LDRIGGLESLANMVVERHTKLRNIALASNGSRVPPALSTPLSTEVAAAALLRRATNSRLQRMQFASDDGGQDGALLDAAAAAAAAGPTARAVAKAALDDDAIRPV
jgi:hypothetical protein